MTAPSHDFLEDNIVDVISNTGALLTTASVPVSRYLCHPFCERVSECVSVHPRVRPRLIPHWAAVKRRIFWVARCGCMLMDLLHLLPVSWCSQLPIGSSIFNWQVHGRHTCESLRVELIKSYCRCSLQTHVADVAVDGNCFHYVEKKWCPDNAKQWFIFYSCKNYNCHEYNYADNYCVKYLSIGSGEGFHSAHDI